MSITITVSGLSGRSTIELPDGATVGDARTEANIDPGMQVRCAGRPLADDAELAGGDHLVTAPPAAKHGTRS